MIRTVVFSLLAVESTLCLLLQRRRRDYPITAAAMLAAALLYGALSAIRYAYGAWAYHDAVGSSRWITMVITAAICIESVILMARTIPGARKFAIATSIIFAGASVVVAAISASITAPGGAPGYMAAQGWSMGCVVYLMANYWLYTRRGALPAMVRIHAYGAMVTMAANATAMVMMSEGRGVYVAEAAGLVLQRVGPIAALLTWQRRP
jgi:hypothetical protein